MEVLDQVASRERGKRDLITLDLLGGCASVGSQHLHQLGQLKASFACHDARLQPLDLNLLPDDAAKPAAAAAAPVAFGSQSVCTIEKVKWALERAERESRGGETEERRRQRMGTAQRREASENGGSPSQSPSPSSSSSITTASLKRRADGQEEGSSDGCDYAGGSLVAAGCPSCLSYVLISKRNPRCPRCDSQVPLPSPPPPPPPPQKRLRTIDLNFALTPL